MIYLLLVAHGSRREASNEEIRQLAKKTGTISSAYDKVRCAFLELAEPSIPDGIRNCIKDGASKVVVLPCFLSAGRHVTTDIPEEVEIVRGEYPDIEISLASYIGLSEDLISLILNLAGKA